MIKTHNHMGGQNTPPLSGNYLENINPATGQCISLVPRSGADDVHRAVGYARLAAPAWGRTSPTQRAGLLQKIAGKIEEKMQAFALAETRDQGKPLSLSMALDIPRAIENFRFFAGALAHDQSACFYGDNGLMSITSRSPVGVCGLITPWNLPLYLLTWKIAPALAMGNTVVCKPSELTSTTAQLLAAAMAEVGLPPGVCNFVFGTGPEAGEPLVLHQEVPLVSFTGGTVTGARIATAVAPQFKKLSLELGGKNANIIFADADLDKAVSTSVRAAFLNQGEICLSGSRIFVQRSLYQEFLNGFLRETARLRVGNPEDPATTLGAVVSADHQRKILSYIAIAQEEGGRIACGGGSLKQEAPCAAGCFVAPTVVTDLPEHSRLLKEEIFGPVVTVSAFDTEDEVVELANGVAYGLSCSLFTTDLGRAQRLPKQIQAGTIWVNTWLARDLRVPFGGMKASGLGREGGSHSLEFYSETKTIAFGG